MTVLEDGQAPAVDHPLGHRPELRQKFGFWSMLGISFVILGTWPAMGTSMSIATPSGGPVALLYGLVAAGIGTLAAAASLAELCSVYPTNGAQYEWTSILSPPQYQRYISYVCGWVVTASWWALAATGPSLFATLTIALVQITNEDYVFQKWHQFLIYTLVEIAAGCINGFGTALLPWIGRGAFFLSCTGFVVIAIVVLATADTHQSARFVFTEFINQTGWNDGMTWLLGFVQGCFCLTAFDAVTHLVEEMPHPRKDAPRTIVISVILGTSTAFVFMICILFSVQDVDEMVVSRFGPMSTVFKQATKSNGGVIGMTLILMIILLFSSTEVVTSSSRLTAAFARQGGTPFGKVICKVNKKRDLPLNSMFLTNAVVIIFGLIYLGTDMAFNAIVNACVAGLSISYFIPIMVLLCRGRSILPKREFSLGVMGYPINIFSAVYLAFTIVLFMFPSTPHPSPGEMNYAIVAIGIVVFVATVYWFVAGSKAYEAPNVHVVDADGDSPGEVWSEDAGTKHDGGRT